MTRTTYGRASGPRHARPVPRPSLVRVAARSAFEGGVFLFVLGVIVFGLWMVAP